MPYQGRNLTDGQRWWRETRFPEIEAKAYELLMRYERKFGRFDGCVVRTEPLLQVLDCELVYFDDSDREHHGIPKNAIGALKPVQRLVFIHSGITNAGRESQTIGEEIGHFVLHAKGVPDLGQRSLFEEPLGDDDQIFCRMPDTSYIDNEVEPRWMSQEASFFSACLQMPKERYGPTAGKFLREALHMRPAPFHHGDPFEIKVQRIKDRVAQFHGVKLNPEEWLNQAWELFDTGLVRDVLDEMHFLHGGAVSIQAQRRRLVELGLLHDVSDVFAEHLGIQQVPRFQHFILSDSVAAKK